MVHINEEFSGGQMSSKARHMQTGAPTPQRRVDTDVTIDERHDDVITFEQGGQMERRERFHATLQQCTHHCTTTQRALTQ